MNHVIVGDDFKANLYQEYLESTGDTVVRSLTAEGPFDLGFICGNNQNTIDKHERINVNSSIKLLAPKCKVLVTPKLDTFKQWSDENDTYSACQIVMAKPDLYRPQVEMLQDIRSMKNIIHDIEICWDNIIGLIHIAHVVAGPLSDPIIHNDTMIFRNFGINTRCEESDYNEITVNFIDGSVSTHSFTTHNKIAEHNMIQDLFGLKKFNLGAYQKHFMLDRFVHLLLE